MRAKLITQSNNIIMKENQATMKYTISMVGQVMGVIASIIKRMAAETLQDGHGTPTEWGTISMRTSIYHFS